VVGGGARAKEEAEGGALAGKQGEG